MSNPASLNPWQSPAWQPRERLELLLALTGTDLRARYGRGSAGRQVARGFVLGRAGAPNEADVARARSEAREDTLTEGRASARRQIERIRKSAAERGRVKGKRAGTEEGRVAGEAEVANSPYGATLLPAPQLPTDMNSGPSYAVSTLTDQPTEIIVGNHSVLQDISWTTWGEDVAEGSGTRLGVECVPNCAEGPPTYDTITLKAWEPSFAPDGQRYYSKLTIEGPQTPRLTLEVQAY